MAFVVVTAAVSVPSSKSSSSLALSSRTALSSTDRITNFNKKNLYLRNVSKSVSVTVRAEVTTGVQAKVERVSRKDDVNLVLHKHSPDKPFIGRCRQNTKLTDASAPNETWHMVFNTEGNFQYREGQYIGVIPDGTDLRNLRMYSMASSAVGDLGDSKTGSLCVERVAGGVASNFLCDLKPGDEVPITGPYGRTMLMPRDPNATIIMFATRTGIAPFRGFTRKMFIDQPDKYKNGFAWLFFEVPTLGSLLYKQEFDEMIEKHPDNFKADYAITEDGMDIQTRMSEHAEKLWDLFNKFDTYVYVCGPKGMEIRIDAFMVLLAAKHGVEWRTFKRELELKDQWNVEVY